MKKFLILFLCISGAVMGQVPTVKSVSDVAVIRQQYRQIIDSDDEKRYSYDLINLFNSIMLTEKTAPYYYGILISIYEIIDNPNNPYHNLTREQKAENTEKIRNLLTEKNQVFVKLERDAVYDTPNSPWTVETPSMCIGWTQPHVIYSETLKKMGVETYEVGEEQEIGYDFESLLTHLPKLIRQYGDLTYKEYNEKGEIIYSSSYGDKFFEYLLSSSISNDENGNITVYDGERTWLNASEHQRWTQWVKEQMPYFKDHVTKAKAYYYTNDFEAAKRELLEAKREKVPNPEIDNYLYAVNNMLLLQKNPQLKKGLPNKVFSSGWKRPVKGEDNLSTPFVMADFNEDGLLDEAILLSPQTVSKFHNDMALFVYVSKPDGKYSVQKITTANLLMNGYQMIDRDDRMASLYKGIDELAPRPTKALSIFYTRKNEILEGHYGDVQIIWDKAQQKMVGIGDSEPYWSQSHWLKYIK